MPTRWALALALLCVAAAPAAAKTYTAERYDVQIEMQQDGSLRITETIVLHFQDGSFSQFFREIPLRRTDGIEILSAALDGRRLDWGDDVGQAEITGRSHRRVRWRFPETTASRHTFTLSYLVRGAVRQEEDADLLAWRALPGDHDYTIASSTITVETNAPLVRDPDVGTRRTGAVTIVPADRGLIVSALDLGRNGYVELRLAYAPGSLIAMPPEWQRRRQQATAAAPMWGAMAAGLLAMGLVPFIALRARYDGALPDDQPGTEPLRHPPDTSPPEVAGALLSRGQTKTPHAMAALFGLADRGSVTIAQTSKRRRSRTFEVRLTDRARARTDVERAVLDVVFTGKHGAEAQVALPAAARRLMRHPRPIRAAMQQALEREGLWHPARARVRRQYLVAGTVLLVLGGLAVIPAALLVDRYLGWPLLGPAALVLAGVIGLSMGTTLTPLSNEGVRRAARWASYRRHLKLVTRDRATLQSPHAGRLLATAVALGLASEWSRYLKTHDEHVPGWFEGWSPGEGSAAFVAMMAAVSPGTSGAGAGAGAGAAAGGGASGAS